jgi:hypothetical protein
MSFDKVEVRVFSGPDQVQVGSNTEPDLIVINNGPKGDKGDTGETGATGAAGPNSVTSATTSDGTADLDVDTITGDGSGLTGLVSSQITDASMGATDESVVNVLAKFGPYGELSATQFQASAISVIPNGIINLASTNVGGVVTLNGELATDVRSIAFPNASGTIALTSSATGTIASDDITDFTAAVEAIAPDAVTSETTSDGTASLDISNLTLSQDVTSGLQTAMTLSGNPTTVGDGQQIIWQWYNGGSPVTTAAITTEATGSTSDKLLFKTSFGGSLATSLDLNNSLATFSGVVSSLGSTYQTGSTFTYNGASAAAHRTALGVSASGDTVLKSAYTPAHSLLVQQSGTGSPSSLSVGNNTILGRASGGGSNIAALSGSDARTVMGLGTLATVNGGTGVATALAVNVGTSGAFVVNGGTATNMTMAGTTTESPHSIGNSGTSQTLDLANGTFQSVTMTGNCTFTMPTATAGRSFTLRVNTGAGGFAGTFTGVKWTGNVAPVLTATASRLDIIAFVADGTNWYGVITQNFTP